jgi:hypothetical protein
MHWSMNSVGVLAAALGLLAGVFISAFAMVFGIRGPFTDRPASNLNRRAVRLIDESALTLLTAALFSGIDAIWLAIIDAMTAQGHQIGVWQTSLSIALSTVVGMYFLLAVRRLHVLYVDTFAPVWQLKVDRTERDISLEEAARIKSGSLG